MASKRLSFGTKLITREVKRRIALLVVLFLLSFIITTVLLNTKRETRTGIEVVGQNMPQIDIRTEGETLARLNGYYLPMQVGSMKTELVPISNNREFDIEIYTPNRTIDSIAYEINSRDGSRKISSGNITDYRKTGDVIESHIQLSNLVDPGKEYSLNLQLTMDGEIAYYYTTVVYPKDCREMECLEFARYFCETAMSDRYEELALYMEPAQDRGDRNLTNVSITSPLDDIGWIGFGEIQAEDFRAEFIEIDSSYTAVNLKYDVKAEDEGQLTEYAVEEYYRMRAGQERIYLLDFNRKIYQKHIDYTVNIQDDNLIIGQTSEDIQYMKNQTGANVAFVWNGCLYEYDSVTATLSKVFELPDIGKREHDINIRQIDENGNIDYIVYGYMTGGAHEGYCGIGLYHHEYDDNISTEQAFILINHNFESIKSAFRDDIYVVGRDMIYLSVEEELISVNLANNEIKTLHNMRNGNSYALSRGGRYLAYTDASVDGIFVKDLSTDKSIVIRDIGENKTARVIGFVGEDLIYGVEDKSDFTRENISDAIFPYEKLVIENIQNSDHQVVKEYSIPGKFITRVIRQSQASFSIELSDRTATGFVTYNVDSLQSTASITDNPVELFKQNHGRQSRVEIRLNDNAKKRASSINIKDYRETSILHREGEKLIYNIEMTGPQYYAYVGMNSISSSYNLAKCIVDAYEKQGYCLDVNGNIIWQYGRGGSRPTIKMDKLGDTTPLNIKGINLAQALSYVYRGNPVVVNAGMEDMFTIIGYSENSITILLPNNEEKRLLIDETTNARISNCRTLTALMSES